MQEQNVPASARDSQAEEFERQLEERIAAMEKPGCRFPARFAAKDYLAVALVAAACLALVLVGGCL